MTIEGSIKLQEKINRLESELYRKSEEIKQLNKLIRKFRIMFKKGIEL